MKRLLTLSLSLILALTTLFALPFSAGALPEGGNTIRIMDEKAAWDHDYENADFALYDSTGSYDVRNNYEGFSYDADANEITINKLDTVNHWFALLIENMGDISVKVVDECGLLFLRASHSNVTLKGDGNLTLNYTVPMEEYDSEKEETYTEYCRIFSESIIIEDGSIDLGTVSVDANGRDDDVIVITSNTPMEDVNDYFKYGIVSEDIKWDYQVSGGPQQQNEWNDTMNVYTEFPKTNIYKLEGSDEQDNYWVKSNWGGNDYYHEYYFGKLTEVDGVWYENADRNNGAFEYSTSGVANGDYTFTAYAEDYEFPESMINGAGNAVAMLTRGTDSNDRVYVKNGEEYIYSFNNFVNNAVEPVNLATPTYSESIYKLESSGTRQYLVFEEEIPVEGYNAEPEQVGDIYVVDGKEYTSVWDARNAVMSKYYNARDKYLEDNGYTAKTTTVDYPYTYTYYALNSHLLFTPKAGGAEAPASEPASDSTTAAPTTAAPTTAAPAAETTTKAPAVQKETVALTLKSVKVKRSAKSLTLQATLKINKKAVKGKKVTFTFNGKKYTAKTDAKGVAKVTIKKSVLKKLKKGKKISYSAAYGKKTVKKTVKVQ